MIIWKYVITVSESTKRIIEDKILEKYDLTTILDYIAKIKPANPNKINEKFIKSNIYYQYRFVCSGVNYIDFELFKEKKVFCNTEHEVYFNKLYNIWKEIQMNKEEQNVLSKNNAESSYYYCKNNKEANIALHEDIIIKSNDLRYIYCFAENIKGANITRLEDAIIKSNDVSYIYYFARDIENVNIVKLEEVIIKSNDANYIYSFAEVIKGANINKLENAIIKTNNVYYIYIFARDIKNSNLDKFKNILENSEFKEKFAKLYAEWKEQNLIREKEILSGATRYPIRDSYEFCKTNPYANLSEHEDFVLKQKDINYALYFARDIPGINVNKLAKVFLNYDYPEYITQYIRKVKNVDLDIFKDYMSKCNNKEEKAEFDRLYSEWKANQMTEEEKNVLVSNSSKESKVPSNEEVDKAVNKAIEEEIKEKTNEKVLDFFKANYPLVNLEELQKAMEYLDEKSIYGRRGEGKTNLSKEKFKETDGIEFKTISVESVKESDFTNIKPIKEEAKEDSFFKTNLEEGIYSGIAATVVDNTINIFLNSIKDSVNEQSFNSINSMLNNDIGKSIVYMLIGSGIHFIPSDLKDNKHFAKVAEKCIQNAGSKTTEFGFNFVTTFLLPSLLNAINGPEIKVANKFRISSDNNDEDNVLDLIEFMQSKKAI